MKNAYVLERVTLGNISPNSEFKIVNYIDKDYILEFSDQFPVVVGIVERFLNSTNPKIEEYRKKGYQILKLDRRNAVAVVKDLPLQNKYRLGKEIGRALKT